MQHEPPSRAMCVRYLLLHDGHFHNFTGKALVKLGSPTTALEELVAKQ